MGKPGPLKRLFSILFICFVLVLFAGAKKETQKPSALPEETLLEGLKLRCIGPANMGGRIDDFAVVENNPGIIYAGTASGGVWKTVNNGITWEPIFDNQVTSTIGDVTVAPSNPDIVWVGTGEPNNRQSSSWGEGVFKSTDGGKTWKNMGLKDTRHIGRIVIHPVNPDIVYVAALGHLWGPNKERGLFKTSDGGKTWINTKFIDENTGFVDVAMDQGSPDTLYAAAYQRRRRGWGFNGGGAGSGLYKTTNGGETWIKLTEGLPSGDTGRIGISIYRTDPSIVYVVLENKRGGVFRSEDKGFTWKKMSSTNPRPMYYSQIRIDPQNDQRIWVLGARMYFSDDGGKSFKTDLIQNIHGDHHAMWINPADSNHIVLGSDGGIYFSYDRGSSWDFVCTLPLGQFYEIGYDLRKPYNVYGGLQDNGSWGGPSSTWYVRGITNDEWFRIGGGDGFYTQVDPSDPNTIYAESQTGYLYRFDLKTGESKMIRPEPDDPKETYRFNWNCPIVISPFDPNTIYYGGNKFFVSRDKGETWEASEDLTHQLDREKMPLMGVLPDRSTLSKHDGIEYYGDITTIAESPLKQGLLIVGTDDGNLQISRDGGKTWENTRSNIPRLPEKIYVTRVVASRFDANTIYATFDNHRNDDYRPYVYVTADLGKSWKNISGNLPDGGTVNVIREHHRSRNLLFIGTERGAFFTIDRGRHWVKIKSNFPVVPVDDIAIHPVENDLILGTHGRSIWILDDITPLEQLSSEVLQSQQHIFSVQPAVMFNPYYHKGSTGHKYFISPNRPFGAIISYYLKEEAKNIKILIRNENEELVRTLKGTGHAGINRITWDLRYETFEAASSLPTSGTFKVRGPFVLPGTYQVILKSADQEAVQKVTIDGDPRIEVTFEDRKKQHDALYALYELTPVLHALGKATVDVKAKLNQTQKNLKEIKDVPEEVDQEIKTAVKEIDAIRTKLVGDPKRGWQGRRSSLRGRLSMLRGSIAGFTGAPSDRQLKRMKQFTQELNDLIARMNKIIDEDIPRINSVLNENKIPHIGGIKKIKK